MQHTGLHNISPLDGRYSEMTSSLQKYFSEKALIRYRIYVEIEYFLALCRLPLPQLKDTDRSDYKNINDIHTLFSDEDVLRVKEIERSTNHDVKAVEYFLKEKFENTGLGSYKEFIHFGLTSQDVNNTAFPLMLRDCVANELLPKTFELLSLLETLSKQWLSHPMLARTHGQPASPTTVGKEIYVFHNRLKKQLNCLSSLNYPAKFGGAAGNMNAHHAAFPEINWIRFANKFVESTLKLKRSEITTQIDHYDGLSEIFDCLKRICIIITDLDRDMWTYISMDYFKQKTVAAEAGSSAMPHKVNPIDFENSEGNCGIAIAIFEHLSAKLPVSRLQRDLSDSTVIRNIGVPVAHLFLALNSTIKGLNKLIINKAAIDKDLENNWQVIAEAIQTILRREGYPEPYEKLKKFTRGNKSIDRKTIHNFIDNLNISTEVKNELKSITPFNYTGILPEI